MKFSKKHPQTLEKLRLHLLFQKIFLPVVILCVLSLLFVSCGSGSTGPGNGNGNGNGSGTGEPPLEPTFTNVQNIFTNYCGDCHIGNRQNGVRLDGYTNVMESEGTQYGGPVIVAENPNSSPLIDKIEPNPEYGDRMPQGRAPLSNDNISLIRSWIESGAPNN